MLKAVLWATLCLPPLAAAEIGPVMLWPEMPGYDLAPRVEYLEDPSGVMLLKQAISPENADRYQKAPQKSGDINFGFSKSTYWLRLRFVVAHDAPLDWLLEIAYPHLDHVAVYAPNAWGSYTTEILGDREPFTGRTYPHYNLVAPLSLKNGAVQTVYVRVQTEGAFIVPLKIWRPAAFAQADAVHLCWLLLYLGMLLCLMIYNGLLFLAMRQSIYLLYSLFAASMTLAQVAYAGLGYQYLWTSFPQFAHPAPLTTLALMGLTGCLFISKFLSTHRMPALQRALRLWMIAFAISIAMGAFFSYDAGVYLGLCTAIAVWLTAIWGGMRLLPSGLPGIGYFIGSWSVLSVAAMVFGMRLLGILESTWLTSYALQIGSMCEMLLLALSLAARVNSMRREKDVAQAQALCAKEEMVIALQSSERELETRIEQRTKELALANQRLNESQEHLQRLVHHDALTGLPNRVLLYDRIDHALSQCRRDHDTLAVLLIDLDSFKPINDRYGHAMGDQLLVAIAQRFNALMRESDTVARLGGDEFVVLLERASDTTAIEKITERLGDEAARPFDIQGLSLCVSASIGIALYPHHGTDAQMLLAHADADMYAKKSPRSDARLQPMVATT